MNSLRSVFYLCISAIAAATFALPANGAPTKIYSINVSAFGVAPVGITIKNETPNGNSTVNSFIIKPPAGTTVSIANPASSAPASVTKDPSSGWIYVNSFDGLKAGSQTPKTITINLVATFSGGPTCGAGYQWTALAYTGNSWGGDQFDPVVGDPPTNQGLQTSTMGCSVRYVPPAGSLPLRAPQDALVNAAITSTDNNAPPSNLPVQAEVVDGSGSRVTAFSGTINLVKTAGPAANVTGNTAVASSGLASFPNLKIDTVGVYQLKATSPGQTDSAPSAPFSIGAGVLDCGGDLALNLTNPNNLPEFDPATGLPVPGWAGAGKRGLSNKDGSPCLLVNYTFTNNILANNSVTFNWAINTQPGAAFSYTVNWKPEYVGPSGVPARVTKVQWFDAFGNLVPPTPVAARACLGPDLPAAYGTLAGGISAAATSLTIDTAFGGSPPPAVPPGYIALLPATPFALTIGTERLTATSLIGTAGTLKTYNVTRGGTNGTVAAAHSFGDKTMTNPLPLDGDGKQMQACIADEGYVIVPPGAPDCPTTGTGAPAVPTACAVVSTTLHDIGDGVMTRD